MTEHQHPELEKMLARIEEKLDSLIQRELDRMQFESLRSQLDRLEKQQRERG